MTHERFRRIALSFPDTIEGAHMGHPDFRVSGRIFATLHDDLKNGMVKLTPEQQELFVRDYPAAFAPENGAWGRQGCTRVQLGKVDEEALGEAMTLACQNTRQRAQSKPAPRKKIATPRKRKS